MYIPAAFAQTRPAELARLIHEHPLGMLVTHTDAGLDANHLPFHFAPAEGEHGILYAHVARANPVWETCATGSPVLVVFRGAQAYVSPSWYPSKHEAHRQVPTWNYEAVHVHGVLVVHDDARFVRRVVARLTQTHEALLPQPWRMGEAAPGYIDEMLTRIVGLEIRVTALEGKAKLSQNREPRDRLSAACALQANGHGELARAMREAGQ